MPKQTKEMLYRIAAREFGLKRLDELCGGKRPWNYRHFSDSPDGGDGGESNAGNDGNGEGGSQQTPAPEPDGSNSKGTPTVARAELDKVIGQRQAFKEQLRTKQEENAALVKQVGELPSSEDMKAFTDWRNAEDDKARDTAIKDGDLEAIEKRIREPLAKENEALRESSQNLQTQLQAIMRDRALSEAATVLGAHNPMQVVELLRSRVTFRNDNGKYVPEFLDENGLPCYDGEANRIVDAKVFVQRFLADPANANLVKAKATPGSAATPPGGPSQPNGDGKIPTTLEQFKALPEDQRQAMAAKMTKEERQSLLKIATPAESGFL